MVIFCNCFFGVGLLAPAVCGNYPRRREEEKIEKRESTIISDQVTAV
jgi:hypothetical protein